MYFTLSTWKQSSNIWQSYYQICYSWGQAFSTVRASSSEIWLGWSPCGNKCMNVSAVSNMCVCMSTVDEDVWALVGNRGVWRSGEEDWVWMPMDGWMWVSFMEGDKGFGASWEWWKHKLYSTRRQPKSVYASGPRGREFEPWKANFHRLKSLTSDVVSENIIELWLTKDPSAFTFFCNQYDSQL